MSERMHIHPDDAGDRLADLKAVGASKGMDVELNRSLPRGTAVVFDPDLVRRMIENRPPLSYGQPDVAWAHCSPALLTTGYSCVDGPRRPCECEGYGGAGHDHRLPRVAEDKPPE